MKKICLLAFFLLVFLFNFNISLAVSSDIQEESIVNYELPYPGLLPDSPLYFFRVARDRIVSFLISDPLKKAEFNLLQADKRMNAGIYLFNKGKTSLAISTISKAENYFEEALDKIDEAGTQGRNINDMRERLRSSVKKHKQELKFLSQKTNPSFRQFFEIEQKRIVGFEKRLDR